MRLLDTRTEVPPRPLRPPKRMTRAPVVERGLGTVQGRAVPDRTVDPPSCLRCRRERPHHRPREATASGRGRANENGTNCAAATRVVMSSAPRRPHHHPLWKTVHAWEGRPDRVPSSTDATDSRRVNARHPATATRPSGPPTAVSTVPPSSTKLSRATTVVHRTALYYLGRRLRGASKE